MRRAEGVGRVARTEFRITPPASGGVCCGRTRRYVGMYAGLIAQEAQTAQPVMFDLHEGMRVGATAHLLSSGDAVHVQLTECQQSEHEERLHRFSTPSGTVELPSLDVHRMRGGFVAPLDWPVVVSVAAEHDRARVILMTVRRAGIRGN